MNFSKILPKNGTSVLNRDHDNHSLSNIFQTLIACE